MTDGGGGGFGGLLRRLRIAAGYSQEALAERAGLSVAGVAALEAGRRNRPRAFTVGVLADALGLDPAERALLAARAAGAPPAQRSVPALAIRQALSPLPPVSLIGREGELELVTGLLLEPGVQVLTLTGPGGAGKTALALAAAARVTGRFPGGVVFVPLESLRDPGLVLATVAAAFGLRDTTQAELRPRLFATLAARRLLLVLDNLEHLLPAGVDVAELAAACPEVTVLATSRTALRLRAERQVRVPALTTEAAVRLFARRARTVDTAFEVNPATEQVIAGICDRLDGMPLAIELAAAWVRLLPPAALLRRLGGQLALLAHGPRDLPERQRTIRATIDWSYRLLSESERRLFAELAVFDGGCTLEAVEAVCQPGPGQQLLGDLGSLMDQSLLTESGGEPHPRLQMQATVAEYARELLEASGADAARRRHAAWALAFAEEAAIDLENAGQVAWLERLDAEQDNMRAALHWALDQQETETAARLLGALQWYWLRRGHHREARTWATDVLTLTGRGAASPAARATALRAAGWLAVQRGDGPAARPLLEEAVTLSRATGDARTLGLALTGLGLAGSWGADPDRSRVTALLTEALDIWRALDWPVGQHMALVNLGFTAYNGGDLDRAEACQRDALAVAERTEAPYRLGSSRLLVPQIELRRGNTGTGTRLIAQALREFQRIQDPLMTANCLFGLALAASTQDARALAANLIGAADALYAASGTRLIAALGPEHRALLEAVTTGLGDDRFEAERQHGATMATAEVIDLALGQLSPDLSQRSGSNAESARRQSSLYLAKRLPVVLPPLQRGHLRTPFLSVFGEPCAAAL
jgi:predicted ATPase/transcriptional regulator with XRE-family HTH domain